MILVISFPGFPGPATSPEPQAGTSRFYYEFEDFDNFFKVQKELYDPILWIKMCHPVLDGPISVPV